MHIYIGQNALLVFTFTPCDIHTQFYTIDRKTMTTKDQTRKKNYIHLYIQIEVLNHS